MSPRNRRAFTLVELLAAMVITVLVLGATATILASINRARVAVDSRSAGDGNARAALTAIEQALRNVCRPHAANQILLEGKDNWIGDMPADRIRFFTISRRVIREGKPESDVREVEFYLSQPEDGSPPVLLRRTDPTNNGEEDGGGVVERVADNVLGLQLNYFNGAEWLDEWPATQHRWPAAIRIRLTVIIDAKQHITRTLGRLVDFPAFTIDKRKAES